MFETVNLFGEMVLNICFRWKKIHVNIVVPNTGNAMSTYKNICVCMYVIKCAVSMEELRDRHSHIIHGKTEVMLIHAATYNNKCS